MNIFFIFASSIVTMRRFIIYLLIIPIVTLSCSREYQKILKSNDYNTKYEAAIKYFNAKDYARSQQLFESILPVYKGTEKEEAISYYLAEGHFLNADFDMASYFFKSYVTTFTTSDKLEECLYKTGYCYYRCSPKSSLDQDYTRKAIEEFQTYLNRYPQGKFSKEANALIVEMRKKLEKKSFANAKTYFDIGQYKAATIAFKNYLVDFPDNDQREDVLFLIVKSGFEMAQKSVEKKQFDRYETVVTDYYTYADEFPNGKYMKDAEKYLSKSQDFIKRFNR